MAVCKINHNDPDGIPEFLCRVCHPELVLTPEQRAALDTADAERRRVAQARQAKEHALGKVQRRLDALEKRAHRQGTLCTVDEKLKLSLEQKAERLLEELKQ